MARQPKPWFWKARRAWFVTIDGQRHNLGPDRKDAVKRFHELMRNPGQPEICVESFAAIADAFLEWVKVNRSEDTFGWYRYRIERFCQRYPDILAVEIRPYHVQKWIDSYPDLRQTTRRNYVRSVKRCLTWARQQGYIDESPLRDMQVPGAERSERFVTPEEFEVFTSWIRDDAFLDLVSVTYECGCRPQEILAVEARHVDLANERWLFPKSEAKGKRAPRIIYLTQNALEITQRLLLRNPDGRLFRNSSGKPWTTSAVNCAFCRVQQRMGRADMKEQGLAVTPEEVQNLIPSLEPTRTVKGQTVDKNAADLRYEAKRKLTFKLAAKHAPKYSLYALRHSWATRALQSGLDGLTVAVLMGHSDPSTLARVYQHLSHNPQHLLQQARRAVG